MFTYLHPHLKGYIIIPICIYISPSYSKHNIQKPQTSLLSCTAWTSINQSINQSINSINSISALRGPEGGENIVVVVVGGGGGGGRFYIALFSAVEQTPCARM